MSEKMFLYYSVAHPYGEPIEWEKSYTETEFKQELLRRYFDRYRDVSQHPLDLYELAEILDWTKTCKVSDKYKYQFGDVYCQAVREQDHD